MSETPQPTSGADASVAGVQIHHTRRLPDFLQSVKLKYVKLGYHYLITHLLTLCLIPLMAIAVVHASQMQYDDVYHLFLHLRYNLVTVLTCSAFLVFGSTFYFLTRPRSVFLVDYSCFHPPSHLRVKFADFIEHSRLTGDFDPSSLNFQRKILERSGLGENTVVPEVMHAIPPRPSMVAARAVAEEVMYGALDSLFATTKINPKKIGILVFAGDDPLGLHASSHHFAATTTTLVIKCQAPPPTPSTSATATSPSSAIKFSV